MKILTKTIILLSAALLLVTSTIAQEGEQRLLPSSHLEPFTSIRVDADIEISLVKVGKSENQRIEYNLGDNEPSKFKFAVKPSGELLISQSKKSKSIDKIQTTIFYNGHINNLRISRAKVKLQSTLSNGLVDISLDNGATLLGSVDCGDIDATIANSSYLSIEGKSHYFTLRASSGAKAELRKVEITSAQIEASQSSVVALNAGERLVASAATKSVVKYWGQPTLLRSRKQLLGGEVIRQGE